MQKRISTKNLISALHAGLLKQELKKYLKPFVLNLDELDCLPVDKNGVDLLFQIIRQLYETGAMIITTNRVFKEWPQIFNNDSTLTSALLDRLLHHTEAVVIEGDSYRMRQVKNNTIDRLVGKKYPSGLIIKKSIYCRKWVFIISL